ncbi:MAG: DNA adenine methylase [Archaeoglobaceae archaeon]
MIGKMIIRYPGSKAYIVDAIIKNLDYSKSCYIELFGGSGAVILNKPPHKNEIYNDINEDLYALFYSLHFHYDEFMAKLDNLFVCEKLFYDLRDMNTSDLSIVDRGVRAFYLYAISFAGKGKDFSYSFDNKGQATDFANKIELLKRLKDRFKRITVLNRDYRKVLEAIKHKTDIMLYADPPYYGSESMYEAEFTWQDHETLAYYFNNAGYSVMLSYEYFDGIYDLYPQSKWHYIEIDKMRTLAYNTKTKERVSRIAKELLIMNYKPKIVRRLI